MLHPCDEDRKYEVFVAPRRPFCKKNGICIESITHLHMKYKMCGMASRNKTPNNWIPVIQRINSVPCVKSPSILYFYMVHAELKKDIAFLYIVSWLPFSCTISFHHNINFFHFCNLDLNSRGSNCWFTSGVKLRC